MNADDDTRSLVAYQWKTWIQYQPEREVKTTLENSYKFLYQCLRWTRSNWRSNWTSLVKKEGKEFYCVRVNSQMRQYVVIFFFSASYLYRWFIFK